MFQGFDLLILNLNDEYFSDPCHFQPPKKHGANLHKEMCTCTDKNLREVVQYNLYALSLLLVGIVLLRDISEKLSNELEKKSLIVPG